MNSKHPHKLSELLKTIKCGGRDHTRMIVRFRDRFTCQVCGKRRTPLQAKNTKKRLFDVHHLNGLCGKKSKGYDRASDTKGLITVCHKCHYNLPEHKCKTKQWAKNISLFWKSKREKVINTPLATSLR